jgi:hypothetical protein
MLLKRPMVGLAQGQGIAEFRGAKGLRLREYEHVRRLLVSLAQRAVVLVGAPNSLFENGALRCSQSALTCLRFLSWRAGRELDPCGSNCPANRWNRGEHLVHSDQDWQQRRVCDSDHFAGGGSSLLPSPLLGAS